MYYPYLRGKQFELKALRDYFKETPDEKFIVPVIEPVNRSSRLLAPALTELKAGNHSYVLILNPSEGDFKHKNVTFTLPEENPDLFAPDGSWVPGYLCTANTESIILEDLNACPYNNVMLFFQNGINVDRESVLRLISHPAVESISVLFRTDPAPRIKNSLIESGKRIIYMEDCFKSQKRNVDYLNDPDQFFSSAFSFYKDRGYYGFSDYTALSSEVVEGGMLPYALAIHLTYLKSLDEIYIHHFVSDSNYDQTNIKGKFQEAAMKIAPFFGQSYPLTPSIQELIARADDPNGYPNLGYLKKLSVKGHLELIHYINTRRGE